MKLTLILITPSVVIGCKVAYGEQYNLPWWHPTLQYVANKYVSFACGWTESHDVYIKKNAIIFHSWIICPRVFFLQLNWIINPFHANHISCPPFILCVVFALDCRPSWSSPAGRR